MALDLARIDAARAAPARTAAPVDAPVKGSALSRLATLRIGGARRANLDDLVLFTQQLALLLQTGNALVPAIGALAAQSRSEGMGHALQMINRRLEEGSTLSECLEQHPRIFNRLYLSTVRAGEASGSLRKGLESLAEILETRRRLRARIREALTYPVVLICIMTAVVIFLMTYMVPRFADLFSGLGDELPWSTRLLLGSAGFIRSRWWALAPMALLVGVGAHFLWRSQVVRHLWDQVKLGAPFVGKLYVQSSLFQLFASLGLLLGSHVPHLEAIRIARTAVSNARYAEFFARLTEHVEAGRGVALAFREADFLPEAAKLMVSTGEASGALDTVMLRLSERYREDLESGIRRMSTLIEPLMLVVMGVMVGFVAISFIVPIFKLSRVVH